MYVKAFDLYQGQGDVDFKLAYSAGYRLAIIKASEALFKDPMFDTNWKKANDAGMIVMTYHFNRSNVDGKNQADFHLNAIKSLIDAVDYTIACWLDIETADGVEVATRKMRALAFWNTILANKNITGPYSNQNYWQTLMNNMALPPQVYGWVASWTPANTPSLPLGWSYEKTKVWQYGVFDQHSWAEPVPGVPVGKHVDVDRWFGTQESLNEFVKKTTTTPPTSHSHLEYESRFTAIETKLRLLETKVTALEQARVYFKITEDLANTYRVKEKNAAGRPVMVPANDIVPKVQYTKGDRVQIKPVMVDADGSINYWQIVGKDLYLRQLDGYVELY